jgi:hypothetical protein
MGVFQRLANTFTGPEKRRSKRRAVTQTAWVYLGGSVPPLVCILWDISDTGARLVIPVPEALPDTFRLLRTRDERPGQLCRVVWRKGSNLGVTFA